MGSSECGLLNKHPFCCFFAAMFGIPENCWARKKAQTTAISMATKSRWGHECKQHELGKKKKLTNQRDVDSETHPLLNGAAGPMVNREATGALFCFYLAYFFAQQSQLTVWTKRLNIQRLNNLSLADRENIHFTATYESVCLRKQRQTLERGWDEVRGRRKKKKKN